MIDLPEIYENANREAEEDEMNEVHSFCGRCNKSYPCDDLLELCKECYDHLKQDSIKTGLRMAMEIAKKELVYNDGCFTVVLNAIQHKLDEMDK